MNNVFVYCEIEGTTVAEVSQELLTKGRKLADELGVQLHAVVAGTGIKGKVEDQILPYGVDRLFVFDGEGLFPYTSAPHTDILVGLFKEVMVVHHSTCGACHMSYEEFKPHMLERGVSRETLSEWEAKGIEGWLEGFHDTEASVRRTVEAVKGHPLVPGDVVVRGFVIDSVTGELKEIR